MHALLPVDAVRAAFGSGLANGRQLEARYFDETGDLFNLFVFFELMSVAAYALTAYKIEERGPLQGAINFAITNSVGSFAMLTGIALLYGRTGALNMAQIGASLIGLGLLTPAGLAASGEYVLEHAFLKGSLFMAAGILLHRFCSVDEYELCGRGRERDIGLRVAAAPPRAAQRRPRAA